MTGRNRGNGMKDVRFQAKDCESLRAATFPHIEKNLPHMAPHCPECGAADLDEGAK